MESSREKKNSANLIKSNENSALNIEKNKDFIPKKHYKKITIGFIITCTYGFIAYIG